MAGEGPYCPAGGKRHGHLIWVASGRWYCPHSDHVTGKFFSDKEAHGEYELEEDDVAVIYERAAHDVIAGRTTLDQAVQAVARSTGRSPAQVREAVTIMVGAIQEKDTDMAEKKAAAKAQAAKKAVKEPGERRRKEHVDGAEFARVRDELGLTNKQAAEATGEAGMGASATYIYIVTHQGSSVDLFAKFEAALRAYAKKNKVKRPKAATVEPAPEASVEVEAEDDEEVTSGAYSESDAETDVETSPSDVIAEAETAEPSIA